MFGFLTRGREKALDKLVADTRAEREASARANAVGLDSLILKRQHEVDQYAAKVTGFFDVIKKHFEYNGLAEYLGTEYKVNTKFDGETEGSRNLRIRWDHTANDMRHKVGFAAFEGYKNEFTLEYFAIVRTDDFNAIREYPNPNFKNKATDESIITVYPYEDKLQSSRIYKKFEGFAAQPHNMPKWFIEYLKAIPKLP